MKKAMGNPLLSWIFWVALVMGHLTVMSICRAATPPAPEKKLERIIVVYPSPGTIFAVLEVTRRKGFFQEEGLDADLVVMRSSVAIPALMSGEIDYAYHAGSALRAAIKGVPVKVIIFAGQKSVHVVVSRPDIKEFSDLRGKTFAVSTPGASEDVITREILRLHGMEPGKDAKLLSVGDGTMRMLALQKGLADASILPAPQNILARKEGYRWILQVGDYLDAPVTGGLLIATSDRKLRENPGQVKRAIRAMLRGVLYMLDHRNEAAEIAASWLKIDKDLAFAVQEVEFKTFIRDGSVGAKGLRGEIELARRQAGIKEAVTPEKIADFTLLEEARRELGLAVQP